MVEDEAMENVNLTRAPEAISRQPCVMGFVSRDWKQCCQP